MATTYEAVYVFDAQVQEEAVDKIQQRIESEITSNGGTLLDSQRWGKRKLSYLIRRKTHGLYHYLLFASDNPELPRLLEQDYNPKRIDTILRSLIVRLEPGEIPTVEPREKEDTDTSAAKDQAIPATETPPAAVTAAETPATEPPPVVVTAADTPPTETPATETPATEPPPAAVTAAETPPAETPPADSGETPPAPGVAAAGEPQSTEPAE